MRSRRFPDYLPGLFCFVVVRLACLELAAAPDASRAAEPRPGTESGRTALVTIASDGRLSYAPYSSRGDILPDFSHCGYGGGGVAPPEVPVRERLEPLPGEGDDIGGTVLLATSRRRQPLVRIGGSAGPQAVEGAGHDVLRGATRRALVCRADR